MYFFTTILCITIWVCKWLKENTGECKSPLNTKFFETHLLGHRGCGKCTSIPENSLKAFEFALTKHSTDGIEFDVHLSKDGVPFVFHDFTLNRLILEEDVAKMPSNFVEELTWEQISSLRFKEDPSFTIPSLDETLDKVTTINPNCKMMIETKGFDRSFERASAIVKAFEKFSLHNQAVAGAFNILMLFYTKKMQPKLPTLLLVEPDHLTSQYTKLYGQPQGLMKSFLNLLDPVYFYLACSLIASILQVNVLGNKNDPETNVEFVQKWNKRGYSVNIWTVNTDEEISRIRNAGGTATSDLVQRENLTVVTPSTLPTALSSSAL
eukprot:gb/GECH01012704.1/.p1 GENE.gb/GECH01012704.1/~~gb/GECH01012704.1/.p1  ORF type:complete len:323 (+),score=48.59 gb/GECH01012704.1/:1-969(+)